MATRPWLVLLIAVALTGSLVAGPASAQQSSDEVRSRLDTAQDRLDELEMLIGRVVDEYNDAVVALEAAEAELDATEVELTSLTAQAGALEDSVVDHVRRLHKLGPAIELSALMVGGDANATGERMSALRHILDAQRIDLEELEATQTSLAAVEERLEQQRQEADARTAEIEERREVVEATIADEQDEIDALNDELASALQREEEARRRDEERRRRAAEQARQERAAQQAREQEQQAATTTSTSSTPPAGPAPAPRANAQVAVDAALSKLGSPYRWGATGPNSFDCSGLMVWAWAQAGVSLPRSSSAQFAGLRSISRSELQPGDLVFAGNPVHHVGMYIGNGQIVHSPYTGAVVSIRSMERPDLRGFARPG
jgi:cell wall-associated NlpC family hydrolase